MPDKSIQGYPEVITSLPEADIKFEGIEAWLLQGQRHQLVFFKMEPSTKVPEHSHPYDQWGMMIDGEMELVINGKPRIIESGDEYVIPAHAPHYANFLRTSRVMDFFSERARYNTKPSK